MRIDAHHHLWDLSVRDQPWTAGLPAIRRSFSLDDLRPELAAANIDRTVVVQTITVAEETPELLALAAVEPVIAGVVGWVDLTAPDVADRIAALKELPGGDRLVSIRHQVQEEPDPNWLTRPEVINGLRAVAGQGLAYDLLIIPVQLPAAIEVVRNLPDGRFVLDHAAKPAIADNGYQAWHGPFAELAALPNVAVKLSGLITEADHDQWTVAEVLPYARTVIEEFGPNRVMFGSDWPVCRVAGGYRRALDVVDAAIGELAAVEQESIMGGTALVWYRLADETGER
ncbi:amidohydrolase family protein [Microlunatus sp. Gsoil 973]|nr:amidohydrolase family protein [Microlunatus sp. Gsoil 973]